MSATDHSGPLLSVVIPNWNGAQFLPTCLDSLARQSWPALETIAVDNASSDNSRDLLRRDYPSVQLVELPQNNGFTGACNAGLRVARGELVALLNNDTEVHPEWAFEVVAAFRRHPQAGSVASKMLLFDRRDHLHTAGDCFSLDGRASNRGVWQRDRGQFEREEYVFSACGGAAVYRRCMLDQIGLLDDDFFFSCEDVDLGWRAQLAGWRCVYTPRAVVYHHLSATGGGVTASYYDGRNLIYLLAKNYPSDLWRIYGLKVLRAQWGLLREALAAWRGAEARARLRGMLAGLVGLPRMLRKRPAIQASRQVSRQYLEELLGGIAS
ncbi:MAG: glycosyltransferase family 2 protein [Anaerolineaceae bacterium]|nr:glycosyltransferase family 2 protein [Anaerolineaceae bacterium]MCY3906132.1 glycosyltransferase family 2 protein [Anaerolineaceae bacterium]